MTNKTPFTYPDYVRHTLNQLMVQIAEEKDELFCQNMSIVNVLYNQLNDFPVTEQVYTLMWNWIYKMVDAKHDDWIKRYWNIANQYCMFKLEYRHMINAKERFREFHIMVCTLLLYKGRYKALNHVLTFTNTLPPKYPLIPSTFTDIFQVYEDLSGQDSFYLERYQMDKVFGGADDGYKKIEGLLADYLALLLVRLDSVNDYNITYSNPLESPQTAAIIERNEVKIFLINFLENHLRELPNKAIRACLSLNEEYKDKALKRLEDYKEKCKNANEHLKVDISEEKRRDIKNDLINALSDNRLPLPLDDKGKNKKGEWIKFTSFKQIELDESLILNCYEKVANNLGEMLIKSLLVQMQRFYVMQFLLNSAIKSLAVPYCDLGKVLKKMSLSKQYTILSMGVSSSLFDEVEGFIRKDDHIFYKDSKVYEMPYANIPSILIMKSDDVPYCKYEEISREELKEKEAKIDEFSMYLYSNIDSLTKDNLILTVKQRIGVFMPRPLRYFRIRIAYQLESDAMIVSNIKSIENYIP